MKIFTTVLFRCRATALLFAVGAFLATTGITYGQIYVSIPGSGEGNGTINNYTTGGSFTTLASGLNIPEGLAFSGTDLYVALNRNNGSYATIVKYDSSGNSSVFSSSTGSASTFGLGFDSQGNLYSAGNTSIMKYTPGGGGTAVTFATPADQPYGLAIDSNSNVYAALRNNNSIVSYNSSGALNWTTTLAAGSSPFGLAVNGSTLYVSNSAANTIDMYSTVNGASLGNFANASDGLSGPYGLAFSGGTLYVANNGGNSINMFTAAHVGTSFGVSGNPAFIAVSAVPEPSTYAAIAGAAMLGVAVWRRRRQGSSRIPAANAAV